MTVAVMKTKAEQAIIEQFDQASSALPGGGWVAALRRSAMSIFAARGLPHRRIEEWKYTDLRERLRDVPAIAPSPAALPTAAELDAALGPLAGIDAHRVVLVDGHFAAGLSDRDFGQHVELKPLGAALISAPGWLQAKFTPERTGGADSLSLLNLAFMTDGILLKVKAGASLGKPVLLVNARVSKAPSSVAVRNIVSVEAGARLDLIEAHVALPGAAPRMHGTFATDVEVADAASVVHTQVVSAGAEASHLARWSASIGTEASYKAFQLTAGIGLARNELAIGFTGPDAKLDISGAFLGRGGDHIDTTLVVDHSTTGCESRELFKGVLDGRARGIFQGKVIVRAEAQKTDGKQMAQALMLSEDAEFDSKPELEIYADDVACGHGSTAAEIDPGMVFYLRSRGIPLAEARAMLIDSFVGEAIDKVESEPLRDALMQIATGWLRQSQAGKD
jgi:Fe-S cluster assembly protein SufD